MLLQLGKLELFWLQSLMLRCTVRAKCVELTKIHQAKSTSVACSLGLIQLMQHRFLNTFELKQLVRVYSEFPTKYHYPALWSHYALFSRQAVLVVSLEIYCILRYSSGYGSHINRGKNKTRSLSSSDIM